jgi:hypothetical protein
MNLIINKMRDVVETRSHSDAESLGLESKAIPRLIPRSLNMNVLEFLRLKAADALWLVKADGFTMTYYSSELRALSKANELALSGKVVTVYCPGNKKLILDPEDAVL